MNIALALLAICAWWAFQLGGPVAAVLAAALIGFDPTFQAMGHLVSVDMALTFGFVACLTALWKWRGGWKVWESFWTRKSSSLNSRCATVRKCNPMMASSIAARNFRGCVSSVLQNSVQ